MTAPVTAETFRLHRGLAITQHRQTARQLDRSLSLSERLHKISDELAADLAAELEDANEHVRFPRGSISPRAVSPPGRVASIKVRRGE